MKYDFYNWYTIDDSDIGCDKVIISQCSESWSDMPNHVYKSICELIADCPAVKQLQKDCVIDFFNKDWSSIYDWNVPKFIKLNSSWCLEWWTLECPCSDELVKASACDRHAWYLEEKLEWWTSDNWLYSIDINTVACDKIEITPDWPDNTFIRSRWVPEDWSWTIKYKNWNIYYEEDLDTDTTSNISYARWYHNGWWAVVPTNTWSTIWWVNNWETSPAWQYHFLWTSTLKWTKDIVRWKWHHLFWLTRPWVYMITLNSCIKNENEAWLKAIRWWIVLDWWWTYTQTYSWLVAWDVKYDWRRYTQYINDFYPDWDSSEYNWKSRHLDLTIMSFCSSYTLHLSNASPDSPVWICFRIRYDTRITWDDWSQDPRTQTDPWSITLTLTNDWPEEPWSISAWTPNEWTNAVITCARIWEYPRLRDL